jgi:hypothetical protein
MTLYHSKITTFAKQRLKLIAAGVSLANVTHNDVMKVLQDIDRIVNEAQLKEYVKANRYVIMQLPTGRKSKEMLKNFINS